MSQVAQLFGEVSAQQLRAACSGCNLKELCLPLGLGDAEMEQLERLIHKGHAAKKGDALYRAGATFTALYAVKSGCFKTCVISEDGREQVTGFHMSGEIIGMEALIRWPQPDGSLIPPDKFIPIAEECGLIVPIGAWVLAEACRQNQAWIREGIARVPVGVNLSARQFDDKDLLDTIKSALDTAGLAPAYLDLELTESLVMRNPEHTRNLLVECKRLGLQLSVDDFGTGYSSLANLKRFPIDRLKIDRSFIKDIASEPDDATIAQTIVAMAHTLRLEVIAEGTETPEQIAFLLQEGCAEAQGYLFSKPVVAAEAEILISRKFADVVGL